MAKYQRKSFFIYPKFQLTFIAWLLLPVLANGAILMTALYLIVRRSEELSNTIGLGSDHLFYSFIDMQKEYMFWVYLSTTLLLAILLIIFGVFLSHRLAGPMVKLKKHFTAVNDGEDAGHIYFRKHDFFKEILPPMNELIDRFSSNKNNES